MSTFFNTREPTSRRTSANFPGVPHVLRLRRRIAPSFTRIDTRTAQMENHLGSEIDSRWNRDRRGGRIRRMARPARAGQASGSDTLVLVKNEIGGSRFPRPRPGLQRPTRAKLALALLAPALRSRRPARPDRDAITTSDACTIHIAERPDCLGLHRSFPQNTTKTSTIPVALRTRTCYFPSVGVLVRRDVGKQRAGCVSNREHGTGADDTAQVPSVLRRVDRASDSLATARRRKGNASQVPRGPVTAAIPLL